MMMAKALAAILISCTSFLAMRTYALVGACAHSSPTRCFEPSRRDTSRLGHVRDRTSTPAMSVAVVRGGKGHKGDRRATPSRGFLRKYLTSLEERPILTKSVSSGIISGTANLIEQALSQKTFNLTDWTSFTLVGTFFIGTVLHFWFNLLDRLAQSEWVKSRVPSTWGRVFLQVGIDQTVGAAMINSGVFAMNTIFSAALTGQLLPLPELCSSIRYKVAGNFGVMMVENLKIWPMVSLINIGYVPVKFRVLVTNFAAVFWNYLMSKWCR